MSNNAQPDYYSHANAFFVAALADDGRDSVSVLDVGCWNGTLGAQLIERFGAVVDGVEQDARQAETAKTSGYRNVFQVDLDELHADVIRDTYDFIFFGDVLEHLKRPDRVLTMLTRQLEPGGRVMISLPNVAFLTCRISHLLGRWDYADYGILDRTHLRFFTRKTMLKLVEDCGLHFEWTRGYVGLRNYPWFIRDTLRLLGRIWPTMFAIQIVISARVKDQV